MNKEKIKMPYLNPDDERPYVVYKWMTEELKLSGRALLVYALIYSFSKKGSSFIYTAKYIQEHVGMKYQSDVFNILNDLVEQGVITKAYFLNSEKRVLYKHNEAALHNLDADIRDIDENILFAVDRWMLTDFSLSGYELQVFAYIRSFEYAGFDASKSAIKSITDHLHISTDTFQKKLKALEQLGVVIIKPVNSERKNQLVIAKTPNGGTSILNNFREEYAENKRRIESLKNENKELNEKIRKTISEWNKIKEDN